MFYAPDTDTAYDALRKGDGSHIEIPSPDGPEYEYHYSFYVFNGKIMKWELSEELVAANARLQRNNALAECDHLMMSDYPITAITAEKKEEWKMYRQDLRDITKQEGFPTNINWPTKPEK